MKTLLFYCAPALLALACQAFAAAPPAVPIEARVAGLVELLDDDDFFVRQKADLELRAMGRDVLPLLQQARQNATSLEVRLRLRRMADDLQVAENAPGLVF